MIINSKLQQLTCEKGITNVPSDLICSDNALAESVGMIYSDGEHRVVQAPKLRQADMIGELSFVHKPSSGETNIISQEQGEVYANGTLIFTGNGPCTFEAVGNTLIVCDDTIHYLIWKPDTSKYVKFDEIPDPEINFFLTQASDASVDHTISLLGMVEGYNTPETVEGKQEDLNNAVAGAYAKNMKTLLQKKMFTRPFFIRYALKMFDGSYTHISQPVLMLPSVTKNTYAYLNTNSKGTYMDLHAYSRGCSLFFSQSNKDLSAFSDIIKEVTIFVSDEIEIYDTALDQTITTRKGTSEYACDAIFRQFLLSPTTYQTFPHGNTVEFLKQRPVGEIVNDITSCSVFYKLCDIGLGTYSNEEMGKHFETHTLENITTQEQLPEDDYFSRSKFYAETMYAYNSRLNLANVKRSFFDGFDFFMPYDNSSASTYEFTVRISTDSGDFVVKTSKPTKQKQGIWFFYPDSRAKEVWIKKGSTLILHENLTEHPGLNGAYYFKGLPTDNDQEPKSASGNPPSATGTKEYLPNKIVTSEVGNPFIFKAEGYNTVGTGRIIGVSTLTQALSQGQFGQYPLLVFATDGIWAMSVNGTGLYATIHPMSREVALESNPCITQTDGAVFFASKKGLMVVTGNTVKCVSEQLSGKTNTFSVGEENMISDMGHFCEYLERAFIAYDYRDSLLWIFNNSYSDCYIYSIKSGTFGKYRFSEAVNRAVNNYPDYLLQSADGVFSLLGRSDINEDDAKYGGTLITRPMKFENALALKSLIDVRNIRQLSGSIGLRIFASNDAVHWWEKDSLRGMPWKYFRFRYDFTGLKATDTFSGAVITTVERRTNKLR